MSHKYRLIHGSRTYIFAPRTHIHIVAMVRIDERLRLRAGGGEERVVKIMMV